MATIFDDVCVHRLTALLFVLSQSHAHLCVLIFLSFYYNRPQCSHGESLYSDRPQCSHGESPILGVIVCVLLFTCVCMQAEMFVWHKCCFACCLQLLQCLCLMSSLQIFLLSGCILHSAAFFFSLSFGYTFVVPSQCRPQFSGGQGIVEKSISGHQKCTGYPVFMFACMG